MCCLEEGVCSVCKELQKAPNEMSYNHKAALTAAAAAVVIQAVAAVQMMPPNQIDWPLTQRGHSWSRIHLYQVCSFPFPLFSHVPEQNSNHPFVSWCQMSCICQHHVLFRMIATSSRLRQQMLLSRWMSAHFGGFFMWSSNLFCIFFKYFTSSVALEHIAWWGEACRSCIEP